MPVDLKKMDKKQLKAFVYSVFNDAVMVLLAFLIIPVLALQFFYPLTKVQSSIVIALDWIIWAAFFFEIILKTYVEKDRLAYIKNNKLDSFINTLIIISPLLEFVSAVFPGTVALRLLRLPRMLRLGVVTGKAGMKWRKANFRIYMGIAAIISAGFLISLLKPNIEISTNDAIWYGTFVSMMAFIYAIISSFIILHVWGEFSALQNEIRKEAVLLRNVCLLSDWLTAKKISREIKEDLLSYAKSNIELFWNGKEKTEGNGRKFLKIIQTTNKFVPRNKKDAATLDNIIKELRGTSTARSNILALANIKTPAIVWALLIFLSVVLIFSAILMGFQNRFLSTAVILVTSIATSLIIALVHDMDFPFQAGFWTIKPEAYFELEELIQKDLKMKKS